MELITSGMLIGSLIVGALAAGGAVAGTYFTAEAAIDSSTKNLKGIEATATATKEAAYQEELTKRADDMLKAQLDADKLAFKIAKFQHGQGNTVEAQELAREILEGIDVRRAEIEEMLARTHEAGQNPNSGSEPHDYGFSDERSVA